MKFHIRHSKADGQFRWRLVEKNGRIVADSAEGYVSEANVRRAIKNVMVGVFGMKGDPDGFIIKDPPA